MSHLINLVLENNFIYLVVITVKIHCGGTAILKPQRNSVVDSKLWALKNF